MHPVFGEGMIRVVQGGERNGWGTGELVQHPDPECLKVLYRVEDVAASKTPLTTLIGHLS